MSSLHLRQGLGIGSSIANEIQGSAVHNSVVLSSTALRVVSDEPVGLGARISGSVA